MTAEVLTRIRKFQMIIKYFRHALHPSKAMAAAEHYPGTHDDNNNHHQREDDEMSESDEPGRNATRASDARRRGC